MKPETIPDQPAFRISQSDLAILKAPPRKTKVEVFCTINRRSRSMSHAYEEMSNGW
jgi:hypothetical protein